MFGRPRTILRRIRQDDRQFQAPQLSGGQDAGGPGEIARTNQAEGRQRDLVGARVAHSRAVGALDGDVGIERRRVLG